MDLKTDLKYWITSTRYQWNI